MAARVEEDSQTGKSSVGFWKPQGSRKPQCYIILIIDNLMLNSMLRCKTQMLLLKVWRVTV